MVDRATEAHAVGMPLEVDGNTRERRPDLIEDLALGLPVKRSQDLDLNDLLPVVGGLDARRDGEADTVEGGACPPSVGSVNPYRRTKEVSHRPQG